MTLADSSHFFEARARGAMRALRMRSADGVLTTADVAAIIAKGTWARVVFIVLMSLTALAAVPLKVTALWCAFMLGWEFALRPLFDRGAVALSRGEERHGVFALAAINFAGACAYAVFSVAAWTSPHPVGMVFATAWMCGCATHGFVYFSSHRLLLISVLAPLLAVAVTAPFVTAGFTPVSAAAAITLVSMIAAAGLVGRDREMLLSMLAKHAVARAQAEQANAAKSQFLTTMSHELRTPLNAIIGYAELIEEEAPPEIVEDAGKIRASARQLLGVINAILDVSKLEAGTIELLREKILVSEVLEQMREAAAPLAAENGNRLVVADAAGLGEIETDHTRVHQCLMHLVSNAAKFTRGGEIRVSAARREVAGAPALVFEVADTGIGIAPEHHARIFEPFVQVETNAARRFEGAGLGLSFVRRMARLMGGDVACASAPGRGSTFTVWVAAG